MMLQWSKTNKLHSVIGLVLLIVLFNSYTVNLLKHNLKSITHVKNTMIYKIPKTSRPMKYILQWTRPDVDPFHLWKKGQETFLERKCKVNECFVTSNRALLRNITDYDAIAFSGRQIIQYRPGPYERSELQKYVFVNIESAQYYPICDKRYDDFFNWTWTYRMESVVPYKYIAIRDVHGNVIGPHKVMSWINVESMKPISQELKERLSSKKKAAAWFVSNCSTKGKREIYVEKLQEELKKYNLDIDIFGGCGPNKCSLRKAQDCLKMIEKNYYFYLSLENSFTPDYVTEKLLTALQNFAVPVVYGAANYTRFMPDGIYLHAGRMSPAALAKKMHNIMNNKERFYGFFKWRNHYSYHTPTDSPDTDEMCKMCEMLHDETLMSKKSAYKYFRRWWNYKMKC